MSDIIAFDHVVDLVHHELEVGGSVDAWDFPQGPQLREYAQEFSTQLHQDGQRVVRAAEAHAVPQDATRRRIAQISPLILGWTIGINLNKKSSVRTELTGLILDPTGMLMETDTIDLHSYEQREAPGYRRADWLRILARNQELKPIQPISIPDLDYHRRKLAKFVVMNDLVLPEGDNS